MDLQNSILQAIQQIPGNTKAEKLKFICQKADEIAVKSKGWESIPDALNLLVTAEVAKKLRKTELIIKALNSEDAFVIQRLLFISDLFADELSPLLQFDFFYQAVLLNAPLKVRTKIIKKVATDLTGKNTKLGQEFFLGVTRTYGVKSALPLLIACCDEFMYEQIIKYRIILSSDFLTKLYANHPYVVLEYLKLSKREENSRARKLHDVSVQNYAVFLPLLIKNHFSEFLDFCETEHFHKRLDSYKNDLKLSKNKTKLFLKKGTRELKVKPDVYLDILDLETVTIRLKTEDFEVIICRMFPKEIQDFNVNKILNLLEYYSSESKVHLIRSIFNELYGDDLYNHPDKITDKFLSLLPTDDRIKQARLKLAKNNCPSSDFEDSWKCYLPVEEVIPEIKIQISKCSGDWERANFLEKMIFVCKVNNDNAALLDILEYFVQRHKNESKEFFCQVLQKLSDLYDLVKLDETHWRVLNCFIKRLEIKSYFSCISIIIEDSIHYCIDNNLPVEENITLYIKCYFAKQLHSWTILKSYPNHERLCLEKFLDMIGILYPDDSKIWIKHKENALEQLISSICDFNYRNKKNNSISQIDITDNPWIIRNIESVLKSENPAVTLKNSLKKLDFVLYNSLVINNDCVNINVYDAEIIIILKKDYMRILKNWQRYLEDVVCYMYNRGTKNFIKAVRWYKDIPINFVEHSLELFHKNKTNKTLIVLGYLLEGPLFEKVVELLLPEKPVIDTDKDDSREEYEIVCDGLKGSKNCNPPISFNIFKNLCYGDYFPEVVKVMDSVARKSSVNKVINFAEYLIEQRVSVKKHGFRLVCLLIPLDQKCSFLLRSWSSETHRSIRRTLLPIIKQIFIETPNEQTWNLMQGCFQDEIVDEEDALNILTILTGVSDEYVVPYIKKAITKFEHLENPSSYSKSKELIKKILSNIDSTFDEILPEEFQLDLLKKHFFEAALVSGIAELESDFIFHVYLKNKNVAHRLSFFTEYLVNFLKSNFNKTDPKNSMSFPARRLMHNLIIDYTIQVAKGYNYPQLTKILKESFGKVMLPVDDPLGFLSLIWIEKFEEAENLTHFGKIVGETLESLIEIFDEKLALMIAISLYDTLCSLSRYSKKKKKDVSIQFLEGIMEVKTVPSYLIATELFFKDIYFISYSKQCAIFEKLRDFSSPVVKTAINRYGLLN